MDLLSELHFTLLLYTDPGSGALLLQILAASVLGGLFYIRKVKDAILGIFTSRNVNSGTSGKPK